MTPQPGARVAFPEGLQEVTYDFRVPTTAVDDVPQLLKDVSTLEGGASRKDGARVVLDGGKSHHAHFSIRVEEKSVRFHLELIRDGISSKRSPISALFPKVSPHLEAKAKSSDTSGLVGATYELKLDDWAPTVDLPFSFPGGVAAIPGAPVMVGVDVEFQQPEAELPIRRGFVSTYPEAKMLVVRLLLVFSGAFEEPIVTHLLDEPHRFLPWFARPKAKAKS
jgi:hypothetical protein